MSQEEVVMTHPHDVSEGDVAAANLDAMRPTAGSLEPRSCTPRGGREYGSHCTGSAGRAHPRGSRAAIHHATPQAATMAGSCPTVPLRDTSHVRVQLVHRGPPGLRLLDRLPYRKAAAFGEDRLPDDRDPPDHRLGQSDGDRRLRDADRPRQLPLPRDD